MGRRLRQKDLLPESRLEGKAVHIVGCGSIGSAVAIALGKMCGENIRLILWDDDEVSWENLAVQFFRVQDIGRPKVEVLAEIIEAFDGPKDVVVRNMRVDEDTLLDGIVMSCTDSMEARKATFTAAYEGGAAFLVDGRMGPEVGTVYSCNLRDEEVEVPYYKERTFLSAGTKVLQEACTAKAIVYTVFTVVGIMVSMLKQYICEIDRPAEVSLDLRYLTPPVFLDPLVVTGREGHGGIPQLGSQSVIDEL